MNDFSQHDLDMEKRLARIEGKVDALTGRIDEIVVTQLKDHGKRLAAMESRMVWVGGWIAGAGLTGAALAWLVEWAAV